MNPLMGYLNGNVMGKAMFAMMSGQSPQVFMQNLAKTEPRLQGLDFSNMEQTARNLCQQQGVDFNQAVEQTKAQIPK